MTKIGRGARSLGRESLMWRGLGEGPVGAVEALLYLLAVHPLLPGGSPSTVMFTPHGRKALMRTEAVVALKPMIGNTGRDPA